MKTSVCNKRGIFSLLMILTVTAAFIFALTVADGKVYAAKKYALPTEVESTYYGEDSFTSLTNIKFDKYGNIKSALAAEAIPLKYKATYRNKKGVLSKVTITDGETSLKKTYDKKGRLTKIVIGDETYKYKSNKKGIISKVTLNGKLYYKVKSIKFHKNGFVSKVVYGNGNVNTYNKDGLMTSVKADGSKYTYSYTKKNGKITKIIVKCDGKKYQKITLKYGKSYTTDVWKYSCLIAHASGPSNACELYAKSVISGVNTIY